MSVALFGGTFNPFHNGHLNLARLARKHFSYDKIIFIPSHIPAHKVVEGDINSTDRLEMLKEVLSPFDWAGISDCEIARGGISYMIDTLKSIIPLYSPIEKPGLIIGDDLAESFLTWKDPQAILSRVDLIVAHRLYKERLILPFTHRYIDNELFALSSSQVREARDKGIDISHLIPPSLLLYMEEKGLYGHKKC